MPIGPSLPPHLAHLANRSSTPSPPPPDGPTSPDVGAEEDAEEDPYGPSLPPHLAKSRSSGPRPASGPGPLAGPSRPPASAHSSGSKARVYDSPSPPRLPSKSTARTSHAYPDDDEDDDDIGPRPEMAGPSSMTTGKSAVEEFREREERRKALREEEGKPKVLQREEWMLVPPTSGVLSNVDPLKKRPTTFSHSTAQSTGPIDTSAWTETPSERAQRLADEVAGIKRKPNVVAGPGASEVTRSGKGSGEERKRRRDEEIANEVARHTKQNRGQSLLEQHQKKDPTKDEPKAIWDHARDMGITGRLLNDQERQAKINDAKGLNDRFGHGKGGAYQI